MTSKEETNIYRIGMIEELKVQNQKLKEKIKELDKAPTFRLYAWYNHEYNWLVIQTIMENCIIAFEWDIIDLREALDLFGWDSDPVRETAWMPLGEL